MALTRIDSNMLSGSPTQLDYKQSVRCATTASITLSGLQTIDGISVVDLDRVLVKDQGTASQNGIYVVSTGAWARSSDMDISNEVTSGAFCYVEAGTSNAASGWALSTTGAIVVGSTNLTYVQITGLGQVTVTSGLTKTGNTISVASGGVTAAKLNADVFTTARSQTNQTLTDASNVVYASAGPSGSAFSFRNKIINGGCQILQRSVGTLANDTSVYGQVDRWFMRVSATTVVSGTLAAAGGISSITNRGVDAANVTTTGNTYYCYGQRIESLNSVVLNGKTVTVSGKFYHNIGSTQTISVNLLKPNTADTYPTNGTGVTDVNSATFSAPTGTYTSFTVQLTVGPSDATGGLELRIGSYGLVSALTGREFVLADVQLEAGSTATPFEHRPISTELALCQRYFFRGVYTYATNPTPFFFKTTMRANPTCTPESGTTFGTSYPDLVNVISGTVGAYYTGSASAEL
jgi:predicted dinucleotide-utilizing enzyme